MFSISVWFERAASEWNCADSPSLNIDLPFLTKHDFPLSTLEGLLSMRGDIFRNSAESFPHSGRSIGSMEIDSGNAMADIDNSILIDSGATMFKARIDYA